MNVQVVEARELYETLQNVGLVSRDEPFGCLEQPERRKWERASELLLGDQEDCEGS